MPESHDVGPRGAGPASASAVRDEFTEPADVRRNWAELGSGKPRLAPVSTHARRPVRPQLSKWVNQDESPSGDRELLPDSYEWRGPAGQHGSRPRADDRRADDGDFGLI